MSIDLSIEKKFFDKILVTFFCLLLVFDQSIFFLSNHAEIFKILALLIAVILGINSVIYSFDKNKIQKLLIFGMIFLFEIGVYLVNNYTYKVGSSFLAIYLFIPFMYLYFSLNNLEKNESSFLMKKITDIVFLLALVSIVFWLGISIFKFVSPSNYVLLSWGVPHFVPTYHNLYFETQHVNLGSFSFVRNSFIYPEGPIYSFVLSFALVYRIFMMKTSIFSFRNFILMITILSTGSSTGFIVLAAIGVLKTLINIKDKRLKMLVFILAMFSIYLIILVILLQKKNDNGNSLMIRLMDITIGFKTGFEHPISGVGYGNYAALLNKMDLSRLSFNGNAGFSSGLALIAAYGGIPLLLNYLVPIAKTIATLKIEKVIFSGLFLFLIVTTIVQVNHLTLLMLPYMLTLKKE